MAKQKTQITEEAVPEAGAATFQESAPQSEPDVTSTDSGEPVEQPEPDTTAEAPQPKQEKAPTAAKAIQKLTGEEPDSFTLGILKSFPAYELLYVDRHGGVFTPDTPKVIRGSAILYKNPHFKA